MDSAEQLQRIYMAGFELQTHDRYPACVSASKGNCIVLVQATPTGLMMVGTPGWKMGELLGVLTEQHGKKVFQAKNEIVDATPERLDELRCFREELSRLLAPSA